MRSVCVVGGGVTGVAAASRAAWEGASVTLVERTSEIGGENGDWLALLNHQEPVGGNLHEALRDAGVFVVLGRSVDSIRSACKVAWAGGRSTRHDAVVIATGSRSLRETFYGASKEGVFILDGRSSYEALGEELKMMNSVVVAGTGPTSVRIADAAADAGISVTIVSSGGRCFRGFGPELGTLIRESAAHRGVPVVEAPLEKALGESAVEAVVAGGRVIPCDGLICIPRAVPTAPLVDVVRSPSGRLVVGDNLETSSPAVFAAGDCAELSSGMPLGDPVSASVGKDSGTVAGANAAGKSPTFHPFHNFLLTIFGPRVGCAGLTSSEARQAGFDPRLAFRRWGEFDACWVVYDQTGSMALGIQTVGEAATKCLDSLRLAVSQRVLLRELARPGGLGSIDITPVADTVREGLRKTERVNG